MDILKKRYTEAEIFNRFTSSVSGRHSAELNKENCLPNSQCPEETSAEDTPTMDEKGIGMYVLSSTLSFLLRSEKDLAVDLARYQQ